jgi:hypothetical protein
MSQVRLLTDCKDQFDEVIAKGEFFLFINFIDKAITIFQCIFCTKNEIFVFEEKKSKMVIVISIKQICGHLTNDFTEASFISKE